MRRVPFLVVALLLAAQPTHADDVLFFGNSFTYGGTVPALQKAGGVPKLVEAIAGAKGKTISTDSVTAGGKTWDYLLGLPKAKEELTKTWDCVVLQDHSNRATEFGDPAAFMRDGEAFGAVIEQHSPKARLVLFETWPRPLDGGFYAHSKGVTGPAGMMTEIHANYAKLRDDLAAKEPGVDVRVAPVGLPHRRR